MDATIQITEITIPRFEITDYGKQNKQIPFDGYEFQFTQELRISEEEKTLQSNFTVKLLEKVDEHTKNELAIMSMINTIRVLNFSDIVKKEGNELMIPDGLIHLLNSMALQHSRGALIAKLQSTNYYNAIMPLIDPKILAPKKV